MCILSIKLGIEVVGKEGSCTSEALTSPLGNGRCFTQSISRVSAANVHFYIGTAGWAVPKELGARTAAASRLEEYAHHFKTAEINSTFYRHHQESTFRRWADTVPTGFRFAVKMHRSVTHERRLKNAAPAVAFIRMIQALGEKLGPVLIQLPPSLAFTGNEGDVFAPLREEYGGPLVLEPRHPSWSTSPAIDLMKHYHVSCAAADPSFITDDLPPLGDPTLRYFRLHGQPRTYWSAYSDEELQTRAYHIRELLNGRVSVWVLFDNTAAGAAFANATSLQRMCIALLDADQPG